MTGDGPEATAREFATAGDPVWVRPIPGGHINGTWEVATRDASRREHRYVLQRLNPRVFPSPQLVMDNVARVTAHLQERIERAGLPDPGRRSLRLVLTRAGERWHRATDGAGWRMCDLIPDAETLLAPRGADDARRAARAFGEFGRWLDDYRGPPLAETLPGFHDTPARWRALAAAVRKDAVGRASGAATELRRLEEARGVGHLIPEALARGEIPRRIAHNDAKLSNVLFDRRSGEALAVIDLDTVMPGTRLSDFGDLVRSLVSTAREDEPEPARVEADPALFRAIVTGYMEALGSTLTEPERTLLTGAARAMVFEQSVRFLTDHLEGDRYYGVSHPEHNLVRARAQLALYESLTRQAPAFDAIVREQSAPRPLRSRSSCEP